MKRFWTGLLSCMTIILLTTFLPAAAAANAIPANCGAWNTVSSWDVGAASFLDAVTTVSANDVWAVGAYGNSEELLDRTLIEQWDGMTWSLVPSPNVPNALDDQLYAVGAVSANDAWAVGESDNSNSDNHNILTEHWDGNTWSIIASPTGNRVVYGVAAISTSNVWAVGATVNQTTGHGKSLIMQWNGTSWSIVPSPNVGSVYNTLQSVVAVSANDIWAVGYYGNVLFGPTKTLIEHWNGTRWSVVPSPNSGTGTNVLNGVASVSTNDVWAVGYAGKQTLTEHWNGTAWSVVPSPNIGTGKNGLNMVAVVSASTVWAAGFASNKTLTEQWNGTSWNVVSNPNVGSGFNYFNGLSADPSTGQTWSVGFFVQSNQLEETLTEFYC